MTGRLRAAKSIHVTNAGRAKARLAIVAVEETDAAFFAPLGASTRRLVEMFTELVAAEAAEGGDRQGARAT